MRLSSRAYSLLKSMQRIQAGELGPHLFIDATAIDEEGWFTLRFVRNIGVRTIAELVESGEVEVRPATDRFCATYRPRLDFGDLWVE